MKFAYLKNVATRVGIVGKWKKRPKFIVSPKSNGGAVIKYTFITENYEVLGSEEECKRIKDSIDEFLLQNEVESLENISMTYKRVEENRASSDYIPDHDSELVIGLVGAVGTEMAVAIGIIKERLSKFGYDTSVIKISDDIIAGFSEISKKSYFSRVDELMTRGNLLRKKTNDDGILAKAVAARISADRTGDATAKMPFKKKAHIISSLKHPEEVSTLRKIYSSGFFLIGIHSLESRRSTYLTVEKNLSKEEAKILIERDANESEAWGQHTRDTYHLSDFFVDHSSNHDKFKKDLWRFLDLIFGKPFVTPTFDEFAMFMAFSASLRSADLSRQVGAVVTKNQAIVSTGANDVPKFGGGLYWPDYGDDSEIVDAPNGRDYVRSGDTNFLVKNEIIDDIVSNVDEASREKIKKILSESRLKDITEYGRIVHAEMEALLSCARGNVSTRDTDLYCTTFPCHNCAKHIVGAGVKRVVYVEPYPKSKALEFHDDSIELKPNFSSSKDKDKKLEPEKIIFEPFVGVGPRSFFNLFSVNLGSGYAIKRKLGNGKPVEWVPENARLRMQMLPTSYLDREAAALPYVKNKLDKYHEEDK